MSENPTDGDQDIRSSPELLRYEALVDSMNDAFGVIDNKGILTYVNQKFSELLDYPIEEIIGKPITNFVDDENLFILQNNIRVRTEGKSSVYELEWTKRTGKKVQTIVSGSPLLDKDGVHRGSFAVVTDISWRIEAEKKYKLLAEQSLQGLTIIQNDRYVYVNPAFAFIVGYTVDEILAMTPEEGWNLIHDDDKKYLLRLASDRRNRIPIPMPYEYRFVRRDGSICWVQAFSSDVEYEGGKAVQVLVTDITEAKVAEEKLRTSQEMLRTVMNSIPEYVFWKDLESVYLGCNENFAMVSGVETPDNIVGKTDFDLAWRDVESELFRALDQEVIKSDRPQMNIISPQLQADGREAWIEANIIPMHDDEGNVIGVIGTFQDITEKRLVEDNLRKSESKYRSLAEQSVQGITILTPEKLLYYNPAFQNLIGYSEEELSSMNAGDVWNLVHPDDRDELRKRMEDRIAGRPISPRYEYRFVRKDGEIRWVESFTSRVEYLGTHAVQTVIVDITERRVSERKLRVATDRALLYLDLMGHDLTQQLQVILNSAALMQNAVEESNKESFMRVIADSIRRCSRIIEEAKATEQLLTTPVRERNLDEALEGIVSAYSSQSENVTFKSKISVRKALIEADDFLELLISNIMMNAIEHNTNDKKTVWVNLFEGESGYIVSIADNGTGIPDPVKASLFDTSRRFGGLGLHTAHYIVEKYNGRIEVHDRVTGDPSQGAEFRIWIPKPNNSVL
ncbi:MAG: PAS domain S-box protein [Candidatus Thorarchaeota archaeon]